MSQQFFNLKSDSEMPTDNSGAENKNIEPKSKEPEVLSVEGLNRAIRGLIESRFVQVWVKGEISNFKAHTSGHFYFSLKDSNSQVRAVMFRGHNSRLKFRPVDGLEVIVRGKVSVYEPRGEYQITCDMMEPVGAGALQRAFEDLKLKLKTEGLFDSQRKRALPSLPRHIAIVTSPTGAAIRDMLNILERRARGLEVTVVPSIVQGAAAIPALKEAFQKAQQIPGVEVIVLARGGGSIEDMWCFNDESLARLIAASPTPVISAVGHEIDFTIADFVADLRAPTPSAAAELVIKNSADIVSKVESLKRMLLVSMDRNLKHQLQHWRQLNLRLVDPKRTLQDLMQRNDDLVARLNFAVQRSLERRKSKLQLIEKRLGTPDSLISDRKNDLEIAEIKLNSALERMMKSFRMRWQNSTSLMDSLSPLKVVDRGYSIVTTGGQLVKSCDQIKQGSEVEIRFANGGAKALINEIFKTKE